MYNLNFCCLEKNRWSQNWQKKWSFFQEFRGIQQITTKIFYGCCMADGNSATEVSPLLVHQKNSPRRGGNGLVDGDGEKNIYT